MSQKLILPINNAKLTASWKTDAYRKRFGFHHYGVDMVSTAGNTLIYSLGAGKVLAAGNDSVLGNTLVLRYDDCVSRTGVVSAVICRLNHLASIQVKAGDKLTKDTPLGHYGNTGQYSAGAHLHIELDRDVDHPYHTPTLSGKSTLFLGTSHGATADTLENPLDWLCLKASAPDKQTYTTANDAYIRPEDKALALYDDQPAKSPEETTVDNAIADGLIAAGERSYWLSVLTGTITPAREKVKGILDTAHILIGK